MKDLQNHHEQVIGLNFLDRGRRDYCAVCRKYTAVRQQADCKAEVLHEGDYVEITVPLQAYVCRVCEHAAVEPKAKQLVLDAFREQHDLLSPEEIKSWLRAHRDWEPGKLAARSGISPESFDECLRGNQLQSFATDFIIRSVMATKNRYSRAMKMVTLGGMQSD